MSEEYILEKVKSGPLLKHFERDYSLFFISTWGKSHTEIMNAPKYGEGAITLNLDIYSGNVCRYYRLVSDNEKLLDVVSRKMITDPELRKDILQNYAKYGQAMLDLFEEIKGEPTIDATFIKRLAETGTNLVGYQILIIHRTDSYEKKFAEHRDILDEIYSLRKKYESAFGLFETHFEMLCKQLLKTRTIGTLQDLKLLTPEEFLAFVESNTLPNSMTERKETVVVSHIPSTEYFFGEEAKQIEQTIRENETIYQGGLNRAILKGQTVYGTGKLVGVCQVITDYEEMRSFEEGKILVTPSTLPKYNHVYTKAKAIIVDEGGILAHAAILCRESHIPGIIGTKIATQVIKNGSNVELNLDSGLVNVL